MIIDCISDMHGEFPVLKRGDLLIVAGDLLANNTIQAWDDFADWMNRQKYEKIVFICGNHDTLVETWDREQDEAGYKGPVSDPNDRIEYLCDSGTEFEGLKIWGSPWTRRFKGMNPDCMAFTVDTDEELAEKWALIPNDTDILITHCPPKYGLDKTCRGEHVGSESLRNWIFINKPGLHVFGHIHGSYGIIRYGTPSEFTFQNFGKPSQSLCLTTLVNASIMNEDYEPVNKPVRIIS